MGKKSDDGHSYRIRGKRWREIESKAWKLSQEAGKLIKPTDIADALVSKNIKDICLSDIEAAKATRED